MVNLFSNYGYTSCWSTMIWVHHTHLIINLFEYNFHNLIKILRLFVQFLFHFYWEHFSTMFWNMFSTMSIENTKESTLRITGHFIYMTISIFHVWTILPIFFFGVCVFSHTWCICYKKAYIICTYLWNLTELLGHTSNGATTKYLADLRWSILLRCSSLLTHSTERISKWSSRILLCSTISSTGWSHHWWLYCLQFLFFFLNSTTKAWVFFIFVIVSRSVK